MQNWDFPTILGVLGILVSIIIGAITLYIAIKIAKRQDGQLRDLDIQKIKHENVRKFFKIHDRSSGFVCAYPAELTGKPFYSINSGDHAALHILVDLIGAPQLKLTPVVRGRPHSIPNAVGVLHLCSPSANDALNEIFPPLVLEGPGDSERQSARAEYKIDLPCWFVHEKGSPIYPPTKDLPYLKVICIRQPHQHIDSPAEPEYRQANQMQGAYVPTFEVLQDVAILLRTHHNGQLIFVLAGIHQYGTVIAAKFLHQLIHAHGKPSEYQDLLLSDNDFVAVVEGSYDVTKLDATIANIKKGYVWVREPNSAAEWERRE
jgi:hypothetical protein